VFDPVSGVLLDEPDVEAIYAVRQLTLMFSKISYSEESPQGDTPGQSYHRKVVSSEREAKAMSDFVQCEQDVRLSDERLDPAYLSDFKRMSGVLFGDLFAKMDREVHWGRLIPKHGPGATADRLTGNGKFDQRTWPRRLERVFPAQEFLAANSRSWEMIRDEVTYLEPGDEIPVRVISVPKTIKTPRIIAIEPTAMQYAQQALLRVFKDVLKEDDFLSHVIGIDDQEPNRALAHRGSQRGDLATLDLSEASDRVSNQHVRAMLEDYPQLLEAVQACRSRKADVPGHGVIRLAKFASMGSALCFPFEAMVFLTVVFLGIERELNAPLSRRTLIRRFGEQVRVFGDDLIVPRDYVLSVVHELSVFGHKVNVSKSYWTGRFRESCGREFYDGQDVGIVKVRENLPTRRQDASVESAVALRNLLYWGGLWRCAQYMDNHLRKLLGVFPNVSSSSTVLGRESALGYEYQRIHPNHHSPLVRGWFMVAKAPESQLRGHGALLKCLLRSARADWGLVPHVPQRRLAIDCESVDAEHLERTGRPERVSIKLGWRSPI
jgi:hypothetical protein